MEATDFQCEHHKVSTQIMHFMVKHRGTQYKFQITMIYGFNDQVLRRGLWQEIEQIYSTMQVPWAVMRDFNCVLHRDERVGRPISVS